MTVPKGLIKIYVTFVSTDKTFLISRYTHDEEDFLFSCVTCAEKYVVFLEIFFVFCFAEQYFPFPLQVANISKALFSHVTKVFISESSVKKLFLLCLQIILDYISFYMKDCVET